MIKKLIWSITATLFILLTLASPVLASYYANFVVTETGGSSYSNLALIHTADVETLADNNYITASGLDTRITTAPGAELPHMLANNSILFVTDVPASSQTNLRFTTGNTPLTSFATICGDGGHFSLSDSATLELGNNFTTTQIGYVNATAGTNKFLIIKWNSFRTYVSAANEITSQIYGFTDSSYNITPNWEGAYTNASITAIGEPTHWEAVADPVGNPDDIASYLRMQGSTYRKDAFNLQNASIPSAASIENVTVHYRFRSSTTAPAWVTPYLRLNGVESAGTESTNFGTTWTSYNQIISRPGGGSWTGADIQDLQVVVGLKGPSAPHYHQFTQVYVELINVSMPTRVVTATGVSSGLHNITTTADEVDLKIYVDGVEEDSTALGVASATDNSNGWTLMYTRSMLYATNTTIWVDDVRQAWYEPNAIISGTTLPDREGTFQNGTITWGSNPGGLSTSLGSLISSDQLLPSAGTGETSTQDMTGETGQPDWTPSNLPTLASNPFYPFVNMVANTTGIPIGQVWIIAATFIVLAVMLACFTFVPHQLITVLAGGSLTAYFYAMDIYPFWTIFIFILGGVAVLLWERMPSV